MSAVDTSKGFRPRYRLCGAPLTTISVPANATATLTKGDLGTLTSGKVALSATNDTTFMGGVVHTKAYTATTDLVEVYADSDIVYAVYDANARKAGDTLDISGTTGAMTVAASSNVDLIVVAPSTATEETMVMIAHGEHYLQP